METRVEEDCDGYTLKGEYILIQRLQVKGGATNKSGRVVKHIRPSQRIRNGRPQGEGRAENLLPERNRAGAAKRGKS